MSKSHEEFRQVAVEEEDWGLGSSPNIKSKRKKKLDDLPLPDQKRIKIDSSKVMEIGAVLGQLMHEASNANVKGADGHLKLASAPAARST